jgi:hypothetical protein
LRVLILDVDLPYNLEDSLAGLRRLYPGADFTILTHRSSATNSATIRSGGSIGEIWRALKQIDKREFQYSAVPYRIRFLARPKFWFWLIVLLCRGPGQRTLMPISGGPPRLVTPARALVFNPFWIWTWAPFISVIIILTRPYYLVKQILGNFVLTREDRTDEFVGFGEGRSQGGLVYWLTITKQCARYGLFGIADNTYLGTPVSVHSFPLAILALRYLRYRGLIYFSVACISGALVWLSLGQNRPIMLLLIPAVVFSSYLIQHVTNGTWEPLAWGFSSLSIVALIQGRPVLAGAFLAATILAHVGTGLLTSMFVAACTLLVQVSLRNFVLTALTSFVLAIWYVVPFVRSRDKLGRGVQINSLWTGARWRPERLYQSLLYTAFLLATVFSGYRSWSILIFALPLLVLIYNESIYWVFSPYTISTYMLILGAVLLCLHPFPVPLVVFLLLIFTSSEAIYPGFGQRWSDDLTPITLGPKRQRVIDAFSSLTAGRVAFEKPSEDVLWFVRAGLSYVLSALDVDLVNTNFTETGDARIYQRYVRHFNAEATFADFQSACQDCGIKYMVAFTDGFRSRLCEWGGTQIADLPDMAFSPNQDGHTVRLSIFELPWRAAKIQPECEISVGTNSISFMGTQGISYKLSYSYYRGWKASQNGKRLAIRDAAPGMLISPVEDGEVHLLYSYWHYWS